MVAHHIIYDMEDQGASCYVNLPPGFRFEPTDEELVVHFLHRRAAGYPNNMIPDVDLRAFDPWELEGTAYKSDGEWYFYSRKRENGKGKSGYWKQQSNTQDEPIFGSNNMKKIVGWKKKLGFYIGDDSYEIATPWVMQEYHLCNTTRGQRRNLDTDNNKWVLCRVPEVENEYDTSSMYNNSHGCILHHEDDEDEDEVEFELSSTDEVFLSLDDDHDDITFPFSDNY